MRVLWGRATSSNVMKVIWTLEELGLDYERRDAGLHFGLTGTDEYRAMNPTGLVPAWQEDGFAMFESNAICRHICAAFSPGTTLWPDASRARATIDQWMDCQQTRLNRPQSIVFQTLIRTPPEKRDLTALANAVSEAGDAWLMLDAAIGGGEWIAGNAFTLADIAWGVHVHRWFNLAIDRPHTPNLRGWYDRLLVRAAYAGHCAGAIV